MVSKYEIITPMAVQYVNNFTTLIDDTTNNAIKPIAVVTDVIKQAMFIGVIVCNTNDFRSRVISDVQKYMWRM